MNSVYSVLVALMLGLGAGLATSCASPEKAREPGGNQMMLPNGSGTQDPYLKVIEQFSRGETEYAGLYNQFIYKATIINSPIREALLLHEAEYFKWDPTQLEAEREKAAARMQNLTEVFVSFYTPERRNDNLTDSKSIWRLYLDVDGKRYEGRAKKTRKLFAEMQSLYPYHTRWNTPYYIEFEVPTATIERSQVTLIITGPLGSKEVTFPPIQ